MHSRNSAATAKLKGTIQGIIFRTSAAFYGRYVYFSFPRGLPATATTAYVDAMLDKSLASAPHFPDIAILDSISSNVLYQTYDSNAFFHVYNLITRVHFPIPFPFPVTFVNAAVTIHEQTHFKIFAVCIKERRNPLADHEKGGDGSKAPLLFFVFSSESKAWSPVESPSVKVYSSQLLRNRRKPAHVGEEIVYLDLSSHFLIRFQNLNDKFDKIPKITAPWKESIDEATRYAGSGGWLHGVKFNPFKSRFEIYRWTMDAWELRMTGGKNGVKGRVIGLHPIHPALAFMRSEDNDAILMVDIVRNLQWVVVGKKGKNCGQVCFMKGVTELLEAAQRGGEKIEASRCGIPHPHENVDGPQGEVFIISAFEDYDNSKASSSQICEDLSDLII